MPCWRALLVDLGVIALIVRVRLIGLLAAAAGFREKELEIPDTTTVGQLFRLLELPVSGNWTRAKVNGKIKGERHRLAADDEILFFPLGGGG